MERNVSLFFVLNQGNLALCENGYMKEYLKYIKRLVYMGKIAVIDSGIGGLTVAKEIVKQMPHEDIVYFGDQKNCPYGDKNEEQIRQYVYHVVNFLSKFDLKALVIACNTATSVVLDDLVKTCPFPVIGVIEPGSQYALEKTKNKKIGIIGTVKTIESKVYEKTLTLFDSAVEVYSQACPKLAPLIESKENRQEEIHLALEEYLFSFKEIGIDTLILGCTHYPILSEEIQRIMGSEVKLTDPAIRTATKLKEKLYEQNTYNTQESTGEHIFFTSGETETFNQKAKQLLGITVSSKKEDNIFKVPNVAPSK